MSTSKSFSFNEEYLNNLLKYNNIQSNVMCKSFHFVFTVFTSFQTLRSQWGILKGNTFCLSAPQILGYFYVFLCTFYLPASIQISAYINSKPIFNIRYIIHIYPLTFRNYSIEIYCTQDFFWY